MTLDLRSGARGEGARQDDELGANQLQWTIRLMPGAFDQHFLGERWNFIMLDNVNYVYAKVNLHKGGAHAGT